MKGKKAAGYLLALMLSVLFLYGGNRMAQGSIIRGFIQDKDTDYNTSVYAKVTQMGNVDEDKENRLTTVHFSCRVIAGDSTGKELEAKQIVLENDKELYARVSLGDEVVLLPIEEEGQISWVFHDYYRINHLLMLALVFAAFILILGGVKGFNTLVALVLTCASIFFVFLPSIQAGYNIYLSCIVTCVFIIAATFTFINGVNKKSLSAALGCAAGLTFSGIITVVMDGMLKMTGYPSEEAYLLNDIFSNPQFNIKGVIFAMVAIGALGATMDVTMSIASSLTEIKNNNPGITRYAMIKSGLNIGRDIMGTMANTLILAYMGSALMVVLLFSSSGYPVLYLLNKEGISFEVLQSLAGSLGFLLAVPFTTVLCALVFVSPPRVGKDFNAAQGYERRRFKGH